MCLFQSSTRVTLASKEGLQIYIIFYKSTIQTKTKLKKMLEKAQLEDHTDIGAYVAHLKSLIKRLKGMGYNVPDEDAEYRLQLRTKFMLQSYGH